MIAQSPAASSRDLWPLVRWRWGVAWLLLSLFCVPRPAQGEGVAARPCLDADASSSIPRLFVTVTGARSDAGNVTFTLYGSDPAAFLAHKGSIGLIRVLLTMKAAQACFALAAPGSYAVAVYHDENDNHHFDRNFLGLPVEGYGFSNNATVLLAPPSFRAVRIAVHAGANRIAIRLRY